MKKRKSNIAKIIIAVIVLILLILLFFSDKLIKLNKSSNKLAESLENNGNITNEANVPIISAGMIPIKQNGEMWVITNQADKEWYDYGSGKPAYIMLNDGTYQSELVRNMTDKKLAKENVGVSIDQSEDMGSIYMWIPRFAIDDETKDIKYVKYVKSYEEGCTIPEIFTYKQSDSTKPDYLLEGVWIAKDVDTSYTNTISKMESEESVYGFILNTKPKEISSNDISAVQKYINFCGGKVPFFSTDTNRIILQIFNSNNVDSIKANVTYNKTSGKMTVQVTYSSYSIREITHEKGTFTITNGEGNKVTAELEGVNFDDGINIITIIDNNGNIKKISVVVTSYIYATIYADPNEYPYQTLTFSKTINPLNQTYKSSYEISETAVRQWNPYYIKEVIFIDKISPISTESWFSGGTKLGKIEGIENLDTSNVTDMGSMFNGCSSLTSLDVSSFNTNNVKKMNQMFYGCSGLTSLDLSNFNTSNVTRMQGMFYGCSSLTSLDLSNFDTSNVTDMNRMFYNCNGLTLLDISNFNLSSLSSGFCMSDLGLGISSLKEINLSNFYIGNVKNMSGMFNGCSSLISLDLSNFNTSNATNMSDMFYGCSSLTSLDLSNFDTSNVTTMESMFYECKGLTSLDLSNFNTSNVTSMSYMFYGCSSLTSLDLSNFNTSNVTDMGSMFYNCSNLKELDLSNFNTSNVSSMNNMFYKCTNLTQIYVGENWVLATSKSNMFYKCGTDSVTQV